MNIKELQSKLIHLTNRNITQTEIAESLGITKSTISTRIKTNSLLKTSEVKKTADYFDISPELLFAVPQNQTLSNNDETDIDFLPGDVIITDYYPDVFGSCGSGAFVLSGIKEKISVPRYCIKSYTKGKEYSVINARGDSMQPYIQDKDLLIVEHWQDGQIYDNSIYVFGYDNQVFVKRLIKNVDELIIKSDNPDPMYRPRYISKEEMNSVIIIGQIVGLIRGMKG